MLTLSRFHCTLLCNNVCLKHFGRVKSTDIFKRSIILKLPALYCIQYIHIYTYIIYVFFVYILFISSTPAISSSSSSAVAQTFATILANVGSVYLGYILFFILKDVCIVCISTYVINFLLLVCSVTKLRRTVNSDIEASRKKKSWKSHCNCNFLCWFPFHKCILFCFRNYFKQLIICCCRYLFTCLLKLSSLHALYIGSYCSHAAISAFQCFKNVSSPSLC